MQVVDFVTVEQGLVVADHRVAQALIRAHVPEADCLSFREALELALARDDRGAAGLILDCGIIDVTPVEAL